mgnify:FL=1
MSFQIIAITNRALCPQPHEVRIAALCDAGVDRVIVREKDLTEREFSALLDRIDALLLPDQRRRITVNTFVDLAAAKGFPSIQISYDKFERHPDFAREFQEVGISVHGANEAKHVERQGADFCIAGHIFTTQCKPGVEPRGLDFLRHITSNAAIPVYAIGGIDAHNIASVRDAGAAGACLMSALMTCDNVADTIDGLRAALS